MDIFSLLAISHPVAGLTLSLGDLLGFATGLLCVTLTARAHIWNFPVGILNSAILGLVFFDQRLFADSLLQIVFIARSALGWYQWATRGKTSVAQSFRGTGWKEQWTLVMVATMLALVLWQVLLNVKGSAPPLDALITALSLCAQWQLNRRQASSWLWWIAVDLISVPLYWSRELYLISGLYLVFLVICVQGWMHWRRLATSQAPCAPSGRESLA